MYVFDLIDWIEIDGDLALIEPIYLFLRENLSRLKRRLQRERKSDSQASSISKPITIMKPLCIEDTPQL